MRCIKAVRTIYGRIRQRHVEWKRLIYKQTLYMLLVAAFLLLPGAMAQSNDDCAQLAKTLYAMGRLEGYDGLIALGSVIMNRVEGDLFPDTLKEVLNLPGTFRRGMFYDERTYDAARDIMMGQRAIDHDMLYFRKLGTDFTLADVKHGRVIGGYAFSEQPFD